MTLIPKIRSSDVSAVTSVNSGQFIAGQSPPRLRRLAQWVQIVLLVLVLVSSPFQYAIAKCHCRGEGCCGFVATVNEVENCCGASTRACCCATIAGPAEQKTSDRQPAEQCLRCSSQCQCGAIKVGLSDNKIGQTDTVDIPVPPTPLVSLVILKDRLFKCPTQIALADLIPVRLHALLCVWLN